LFPSAQLVKIIDIFSDNWKRGDAGMKYSVLILASLCMLGSVLAKETKKPPVTIQTIDSDTLVGQVWNPNPSPVEAVVLKRRQRAKK